MAREYFRSYLMLLPACCFLCFCFSYTHVCAHAYISEFSQGEYHANVEAIDAEGAELGHDRLQYYSANIRNVEAIDAEGASLGNSSRQASDSARFMPPSNPWAQYVQVVVSVRGRLTKPIHS